MTSPAQRIAAVPAQDRRRPAEDARVRAAGAVLAGEPVAEVAQRHGVDADQVLRWADSLCAGGAEAIGGVGLDRPAVGPHATSVPVEDYMQVIAHELRTPLTAARTGLRVLGRPDLADDLRAQVVATVLDRLGALEQLSLDVLDAVGVASGRIALSPERVDLAVAAQTACSTLGVACDPLLSTPVLFDPQRLQQALLSLLRHALRYVPPEALTVDLTAVTDAAVLTIRMGGLGLLPEQAQEVLEPFGSASRGDGNGLALYVVRTLVVASAGAIGIAGHGEPGHPDAATVLWVRLPRCC